MSKQAFGIFPSNYNSRMDTMADEIEFPLCDNFYC